MLITMSDMGSGGPVMGPTYGMHVYGPRGLSVLTTALSTFVNTREMGLQVLAEKQRWRRLPPLPFPWKACWLPAAMMSPACWFMRPCEEQTANITL